MPAPSLSVTGGAINPHGKQSREKRTECRFDQSYLSFYNFLLQRPIKSCVSDYLTNQCVRVGNWSSSDLIIARNGHQRALWSSINVQFATQAPFARGAYMGKGLCMHV